MINTLLRIIDDENIKYLERDITSINIKGLYFDNIIMVEKSIDTVAERSCIIAEELGHHMTTFSNILDQGNLHNLKEEEKARRWATNFMIDPFKFIEAFQIGIRNRWELSQFLNVTEAFIDEALVHLKKLHGDNIVINEYVIHFDPLWVYKSF